MLSLLQFKSKFVIVFLCIFTLIILTSISSTFEFGLSPAEIVINTEVNENICKTIKISSSLESLTLIVNDYWSEKDGELETRDYSLNAESIDLEIYYDSQINFRKQKTSEICFTPKKPRHFKGIILFEAVGKNLLLGTKVDLIAGKQENLKLASKESITGNAISEFNGRNNNGNNFFMISLGFSFICLLILLFVLLDYAKKRAKNGV